jgi:2-polyprenyl-3-methyl-5-hydroxy-6-metoxy-1,4-benzoquinol methylase
VVSEAKQKYFDVYWQEQDLSRVSARSLWRAEQLYRMVGGRFATLLDVGAGQGELLEFFRGRSYDVTGWDLSPAAVANLRHRGIAAEVVDLESDELIGEFDLVCCCEVLQQVKDPADVLKRLSAVISPGGRLFLSLPNEFHLLRRFGFGKTVASHVSLFSPARARTLAKSAGHDFERIRYQPLVPPRWGKMLIWFGNLLARLLPPLFSLSTMMLLRRRDDG